MGRKIGYVPTAPAQPETIHEEALEGEVFDLVTASFLEGSL
jgi:hypothetical protein